jgi:hypothetical protein
VLHSLRGRLSHARVAYGLGTSEIVLCECWAGWLGRQVVSRRSDDEAHLVQRLNKITARVKVWES